MKTFTLLVTLRPRTTSERRVSGIVSSCTLTTHPGKGGKLEAARSNFGRGGTLASIRWTGLCNLYFSKSQTNEIIMSTNEAQHKMFLRELQELLSLNNVENLCVESQLQV